MQKIKILSGLILEGIAYGISGGIFVVAVLAIQDFLARTGSNNPGFSSSPEQIGLVWLFLGLSISAVFGNLFFGKISKYLFAKWFFIVITSSITTVLIQMTFLINHSTITENLQVYSTEDIYGTIGISLFTKLFTTLTLFIFLFEGCKLLFENLKKRDTFS